MNKNFFLMLLLISVSICFGMEEKKPLAEPIPVAPTLKTICFKVLHAQARQLLRRKPGQPTKKFINATRCIQQDEQQMPQELSREFAQYMIANSSTIRDFFTKIRDNPYITLDYAKDCAPPSLIRFSPNSKKLATESIRCTYNKKSKTHHVHHDINLWDIKTRKSVQLRGHSQKSTSFAFSPNSKQFVTSSFDKTIRLWNTTTGKILHIFTVDSPVHCVCFSPDNNEIAALSTNNVEIWSIDTKKRHHTFNNSDTKNPLYANVLYSSLQYSSDGKQLAAYYYLECTHGITSNTNHISLFNFKEVKLLKHHGAITSFCFSADSAKIVSCCGERIFIWNTHNQIYQELKAHGITAFCLLDDSKTLITANQRIIQFWDISSNQTLLGTQLSGTFIFAITPSTNNTYIVHSDSKGKLNEPFVPFIITNELSCKWIFATKTDSAPNGALIASINDESYVNLHFNFNKTIEDELQSPTQALFLEYAALLLQRNKKIGITRAIKKDIFKTLPLVLQTYLNPHIKLVKLKSKHLE